MTTFQDKQPQSRRALRQEERAERPLTDDVDTPTDAETPPAGGRPKGRRARSNFADGLIEVSGADSQESTPLILPVPSDIAVSSDESAHGDSAQDDSAHDDSAHGDSETTAPPAAVSSEATDEPAPAWAGPSFGFRSAGFDGSTIPPLAPSDDEPDDTTGSDGEAVPPAEVLDEILAAAPDDDSSVAHAFPFAAQVEATSDDDGHQTFQLSEFAPDAIASTDDVASTDDTVASTDDTVASTDDVAEESAAIPVGEPILVSEPVAPIDPVVVEPEERTMTRREWRAWRAQQEAAAAEGAAPSESATSSGSAAQSENPAPAEQPSAAGAPAAAASPSGIPQLVEPKAEPAPALSDAMSEFEALTRGGQTATGQVDAQRDAARDEPDPIVPAFSAPVSTSVASIFSVPTFSAPVAAQPVAEEAVTPTTTEPKTTEPKATEPKATAAEPRAAEPKATAPATAEPRAAEPKAAESKAVKSEPEATGSKPAEAETSDAEESAYVPPVGHWSRQAALDDEHQPLENTLSRDVGGGNVATTTNALVLPMIPQRDDFSSMINSTGEIMVTGTIDLPMSVGATGRDSRHYDDPEVDHLFDAFDNEVANTDSAPVRAITAVSSHTATRGGIESTRKQGNRMLTVLIVTACVMAVGVVGLLVAGFVFDIFQA